MEAILRVLAEDGLIGYITFMLGVTIGWFCGGWRACIHQDHHECIVAETSKQALEILRSRYPDATVWEVVEVSGGSGVWKPTARYQIRSIKWRLSDPLVIERKQPVSEKQKDAK